MKHKPYLLLICIVILASACNPAFYYKPDPLNTNPNNTFISGGITVAISQTPFTRVVIGAIKPANDQLKLVIAYQNYGLDRVDVIPDSIKVMVTDGDKTKYLAVYPADQYLKKLQHQQNFALVMQGLSAGFTNSQAGYSRSTTTTVSPTGTNYVSTSTTTTYDANKVAEANRKTSQEIEQAANNNANYNQSINQGLIRTNTLFKGQSISGYVVINTSNSFDRNITIEVPFGNDLHKFTFVPNK